MNGNLGLFTLYASMICHKPNWGKWDGPVRYCKAMFHVTDSPSLSCVYIGWGVLVCVAVAQKATEKCQGYVYPFNTISIPKLKKSPAVAIIE